MKGGHDLGGKQGLGAINPEAENSEPTFHAEWERRVFAMTLATGMLGQWNIDESRFARESQHPVDYLAHSYYENWLAGLQQLLMKKGLLQTLEELDDTQTKPRPTLSSSLRVPDAEAALKIIGSGGPTEMRSSVPPRFKEGDCVLARKLQTSGHSRLPTYVQGSLGIIEQDYGCHVYPDKNAHGDHVGERLYRVRFTSESLWGNRQENNEVLVDLWEPYLEAGANSGSN